MLLMQSMKVFHITLIPFLVSNLNCVFLGEELHRNVQTSCSEFCFWCASTLCSDMRSRICPVCSSRTKSLPIQ